MSQIKKIRRIILVLSLALLFLMVIIYLFNNIELANLIGSIGFGMFVTVVITYTPELIRKGYIERF